MDYYSDSDDYSNYDDDEEEDSSSEEDCRHCDARYKIRNRQRHMENVHKCPYCTNYMPKESIQGHIERKHMDACSYCDQWFLPAQMHQHELTHFIRCQYCSQNILKQNLNAHVADRHPFHATIGMIRKLNDDEFNRLVAQNKVYAKDGHIFIK